MKVRKLLVMMLALLSVTAVQAQRFTDKLDRGVVAVNTTGGVFVSWRIQAEEYYGVKYNLYRGDTKIAENLTVSNYKDAGGSASSTYSVAAVVNGIEQGKSKPVATWGTDYLEITPKHPKEIKSTLRPNDATVADVDGDGIVEIIMKYDNLSESSQSYPKYGPAFDGVDSHEYTIFEVMKLDGTVLWWINCGPNMGDFQNNEQNIAAYDWDMDGKAECIMRAADGTVVHMADGTTYTVGNADANVRSATGGGTNWFVITNNEYLLYMNGATGKPYQCLPYPLKLLEDNETDVNKAWGDGYGHRASKHFFGAPYLDGRKPYIFLGRGIYTRHKFITYEVDTLTHELKENWRWYNNSNGPWKGQGYHNYAVADVDWDGRDEIVFGSMVIDDNGKGLSTTGYGHGDAQHHSDFNPYVHGHESFACLEESPVFGNNYRDATTSKVYYKFTATKDDGRCIMGNFSNSVPGSFGSSGGDWATPVSSITNSKLSDYGTNGMAQNFNCYWDGDLCEETFNGTGSPNYDDHPGAIYKYGQGLMKEFTGTFTNNWTKATPCFMGDFLGDWRHEFIVRTADNNIRIYTTTYETPWRVYSMWYDHQQRNATVWQMNGYNQPPHTSYFLGELEGITTPPPALTMTDRTEVANGKTISHSGKTVITCETNDMTVAVEDGATPYIYIDNAPSWVQGSAPSECTTKDTPISYTYYTHTLTGGAFAGDMRLVKQGDGILTLPNVTQTYTGPTEVWAGTLNFDGTLQNSRLWLNRFGELNTDGGTFAKGIQADYASVIRPGGKEAKASSITTDSLILNMGAIVELDIYSDGFAADQINANVLTIEKKNWEYGPEYSTPVFRVNAHAAAGEESIADGKYVLGTVKKVVGNLSDIVVDNLSNQKAELSLEGDKLCMTITNFEGIPMTWNGDKSSNWNLDKEANFIKNDGGDATNFFTGSQVTFNDAAANFNVNIDGKVSPREVIFDNTKQYTVSGDSIVGLPEFLKRNTGSVYLNNLNRVGNTTISGGCVYVSALANGIGTDVGSLGDIKKTITLTTQGGLGVTESLTNEQTIYCGQGGGVIDVASGKTLTQNALIGMRNSGTLTKNGGGTLLLGANVTATSIIVNGGTLTSNFGTPYSNKVTLNNGTGVSGIGMRSAALNVVGTNVTWTLPSNYYTDVNCALSGSGTVTIVPTNTVNRVRITGNWSAFTGTVKYTNTSIVMPIKTNLNLSNGTLDLAASTKVAAVGNTVTIGKLVGSGMLQQPITDFNSQSAPSGSNTWRVGNSSEALGDFTFDGYLYDAAGSNKSNFEKIGSCTMNITKAWENSGTVKITEGELRFAQGITLGTGALTVAEGAVLSGSLSNTKTAAKKKPITNSSLTVAGTLWPSYIENSVAYSYFTIGTKPTTFQSTGVLKVGLKSCSGSSSVSNTCLLGDGTSSTVTFADGATIEAYIGDDFKLSTTTEEKTDSFKVLLDIPNIIVNGKLNYVLPALPAHYYWKNLYDDTLFAKTGCLYVGYLALPGDVNGDGKVTMADANMTVNATLKGAANIPGFSIVHADVDGDGVITMQDAYEIVNIILGKR